MHINSHDVMMYSYKNSYELYYIYQARSKLICKKSKPVAYP